MREIYQMFKGTIDPDAVFAAAGADLSGQFYAELYVGLYYEAIGDDRRSQQHMAVAAADRFAPVGGYMHAVARLHQRTSPAMPRSFGKSAPCRSAVRTGPGQGPRSDR